MSVKFLTDLDLFLLKIALILAGVIFLFALIPQEWTKAPKPTRVNHEVLASATPNIVLIQIDSLRADRMGVYGYDKNTTPFLDSIFAKGVTFENAIAPAYLTFQTDAAIFSGLYPSQNGVETWTTPIREDLTLLPKMLSVSGYITAAFVSTSLYKYFKMFDDFDTYHMEQNAKSLAANMEHIFTWLQEKGNDKPFFLFWHIYDAHLPYYAPFTPKVSTYSGPFINTRGWNWAGQSQTHIQRSSKSTPPHEITNEDVEYLNESYDAGVQYVDQELRSFFESYALQYPEDFDNTVFIITAEHGDDLKEHGFIFHRDLYDVNTRVPLAIVYPKALSSERITAPVSLIDLLPTLLAFAHVPNANPREGKNLLTLIEMPDFSWNNRYIFTERAPYGEFAVRKGNWKYILRNPLTKKYAPSMLAEHHPDAVAEQFFVDIRSHDIQWINELFDLSKDPYEKNNLIGTNQKIELELHEVVTTFKNRMEKESASYEHMRAEDPAIPLTYP